MGRKKRYWEAPFLMVIAGRSLLVGLFAWLLGNGALHLFPAKRLHLNRIGDWISMMMFSPVEIFLSLAMLVLATLLLIGLLLFHISQSIYQKYTQNVWWHVLLGFFSVFVLAVQMIKMPIATMTTMLALGLYAIASGGQLFLGKRRN
ncbi:hypothetical protein [Brevibacillus reuszeri]|nr:hypothetical protein [Brevibacillus reuszeri]MED1857537.1 hypothetical protein [Brevibacillus reuszeri]